MSDPELPSHERDIADASSLFRDDPGPRAAEPAPAPPAADPGEAYDVGEADPDVVRPTTRVPVDEPPARGSRPVRGSEGETAGRATPTRPDPSADVEQVWSRGAEWGATVAVLAMAGLGVAFVTYVCLSLELYGVAFLALVLGGLWMALLSYPILITLERPVRVTPEQAVRDYYAALSHHRPHYRRMWLLLSRTGRVSGSFASFEGFVTYWQGRLAELKRGHASSFTPLKFEVVDFKSEKSAGREELPASFTVQVFVRGRHAEGPVSTTRVSTSFVKGPDRMWYLDRGTLP